MNRFDYCPTLAELLSSRVTVGSDGKQQQLVAASTENNLICLRNLFLERRPKATLEIGLSVAASALAFLQSHHEIAQAGENQHTAIDPFQASVWKNAGLMAIQRAGLGAHLDFRQDFSSIELPRLLKEGRQYDLIYIDGSHIFEDVFVDAYYCARLLSEGGVMLFDDSSDPHVKKVIAFLRGSLAPSLAEIDAGRYRPDGNSARYRIAKLLGKSQLTAFERRGKVERPWDAPFRSF